MRSLLTTSPPTKRPARRLRFSLRLLLVTLTLLCLALGWWTHRAREQRRIVERIREAGGRIYYDFERERIGQYFGVHVGYRESDQNRFGGQRWKSPVPQEWLDWLGVDFFHVPIHAEARGLDPVADMLRLTSLEELAIESSQLSDTHLSVIQRLSRLRSLYILPNDHWGIQIGYPKTTKLGDRSLAAIGHLPRIEYLHFYGDRITAEGLKSLAAAGTLREVLVTCCATNVTAADCDCFRRLNKLDGLNIHRWCPIRDGELAIVP